ncbi:hypothetical protein [Burkholderia orbicola]|uniref:hypothetical protein n=1 Tax=Burkholderia orbicola TaxID=2978683 RepID=UPI000AD12DAA
MSGFTNADVPDQSGKTFIVTGANTGIGFEIASTLPNSPDPPRARIRFACGK